MGWFFKFLRSSVGAKLMMALTGAFLFIFVVGHLVGNLLTYQGPAALNGYAYSLQNLPLGAIWVVRALLFLIFCSHVLFGIKLTIENSLARPISYAKTATLKASIASRTMVYSGLFILFFIVYHLIHFTFKSFEYVKDRTDMAGLPDVYSMVMEGFSHPLIASFYIVALLVLTLHLGHGIASMFQTFGVRHGRYNVVIEKISPLVALIVTLGMISIPLTIWLGLLG